MHALVHALSKYSTPYGTVYPPTIPGESVDSRIGHVLVSIPGDKDSLLGQCIPGGLDALPGEGDAEWTPPAKPSPPLSDVKPNTKVDPDCSARSVGNPPHLGLPPDSPYPTPYPDAECHAASCDIGKEVLPVKKTIQDTPFPAITTRILLLSYSSSSPSSSINSSARLWPG